MTEHITLGKRDRRRRQYRQILFASTRDGLVDGRRARSASRKAMRRETLLVSSQRQHGALGANFILPFDRKATAVRSRSPAIGDKTVVSDAQRILRLDLLDGHIGEVCSDVGDPLLPVVPRRAAAVSHHGLDKDLSLSGTLASEGDKRVPAEAVRRNSIGQRLGERPEQAVEHSEPGYAAGTTRCREGRVDDAAAWSRDRDGPGKTKIVRNLR